MSSNELQKPLPSSYLNIHLYLQDYYTYRKSITLGFSYEIWSRELNLKSRSYLRMVVVGKRALTESFIEIFSKALKFDEKEEIYFRTLAEYSQAASLTQKRLLEKKLIELMRFDKDRVEVEHYLDFVSNPLLPRIQTLLSFDDIHRSVSVLSQLLNIPETEIEAGLLKLQELGLADFNQEQKSWQSKQRLLKVPTHLGDSALINYHKESLKDAALALNLPKEVRRFRSLLLPLKPSEYNELLGEIENLIQLALNRYKSDQLSERALYQMNLHLFPVTEENPVTKQKENS